jgi:hypothetical protein
MPQTDRNTRRLADLGEFAAVTRWGREGPAAAGHYRSTNSGAVPRVLPFPWGDGEDLTIEEFRAQKPQGEETSSAWKTTGQALSEIDEGEGTKEDAA